MNRPLERLGIEELEVLATKSGVVTDELFILAEELSFRSTSRAQKLLSEVVKSLRMKGVVGRAGIRSTEKQPRLAQTQGSLDLGGTPTAPAIARQPLVGAAPTDNQVSIRTVDASSPSNLTAEQAYKLLKVPMLASWEQIEQSRRELVARAEPDRLAGLAPEKRRALQDECRMINSAYRVLLHARSGVG